MPADKNVFTALSSAERRKLLLWIARDRLTHQQLKARYLAESGYTEPNLTQHRDYLHARGLLAEKWPDGPYRVARGPLQDALAEVARILLSEEKNHILELLSDGATRKIVRALYGERHREKRISDITGLSAKKVARRLADLEGVGVVTKRSMGWTLRPAVAFEILMALLAKRKRTARPVGTAGDGSTGTVASPPVAPHPATASSQPPSRGNPR